MGMTDRDRKLLSIFLVLIFIGGFYFLVIGKKKSAVADAQAAKTTAAKALKSAIAAETVGANQPKHYPVAYSRVVKLGKAIPSDDDYASLLVQINDLATQSQVKFISLSSSSAPATAAAAAASGSTAPTTCGDGSSDATGASGATPDAGVTASTPPSSVTDLTGATGPTANPGKTGFGRAVNDAHEGQNEASADAEAAAKAATEAAKCAAAPTLTDLAAQSAGLTVNSYSFKFEGQFFNLHKIFGKLLHMVTVNNGKVTVTGRLLQIDSIALSTSDFPAIDADVSITGYTLPPTATVSSGSSTDSSSSAAGSPAASSTPAPAQPPAE